MNKSSFDIFEEVTTGKYNSGEEIYTQLMSLGFYAWNNVYPVRSYRDFLSEPGLIIGEKKTIRLVKVNICDLGFTGENQYEANIKDIIDAAKKQGLELCPPEVGPLLAFKYPVWKQKQWYVMTSSFIKEVDTPGIFEIYHSCTIGSISLDYIIYKDRYLTRGMDLIFCLP